MTDEKKKILKNVRKHESKDDSQKTMSSEAKNRLSKAILKRMAILDYTSKELAKRSFVSQGNLSKILNKTQIPNQGTLDALERGLELYPDQLKAILNGEKPRGIPEPLPSLSFNRVLRASRLERDLSYDDLWQALEIWGEPLSKELWIKWEDGRDRPNQEQLQAIGKILKLEDFERGWLFGLSGVPVEWNILEKKTQHELLTVVNEWPHGPAVAIGQPYGTFLCVNLPAYDIVFDTRAVATIAKMRVDAPSLFKVYALMDNFMAHRLTTLPEEEFNKQRRMVIALLQTRLLLYLGQKKVMDQLKYYLDKPNFSDLWNSISPSEMCASAWDMPISLMNKEEKLTFHVFWSPYLPDRRIEIMHLTPTNTEAMEFVRISCRNDNGRAELMDAWGV
jgi:transcriptional regulator with XRE-family HTH domain